MQIGNGYQQVDFSISTLGYIHQFHSIKNTTKRVCILKNIVQN